MHKQMETAFTSGGFTMLQLNPYKPQYVPVQCDANGLIPEELRRSLESKWKSEDTQSSKSDVPKVYNRHFLEGCRLSYAILLTV